MKMGKKYASGLMQVYFMIKEEHLQQLMDNLFDTVKLVDSATQTIVELEIADMDINELTKLGDDENSDDRLV